MKRLSRTRSATGKAVAINGKTEHDGKRQVPSRKDGHDGQQPVAIPQSRSSVELHLKSKKLSDFHFVTDGWIDPSPPPQYTQIPVLPRNISNPEIRNIPQAQESSRKDARRTDGSPPLQSFLRSDSPLRSITTRGRKSSFSSSSTLFERSSTVPITIVVTTPDEEFVPEVESSAGGYFHGPSFRKFRNDSTMSLPAINSQSILDRNRLMPPIDAQVDTRRMRKAREFEDIRHFLIGFLNTKGSQLPKKLRTRIMSVYGITDADLDPRIVAKFGGEGTDLDEGIVLDLGLQGATPTDRDHMRILEMAFQSVMPAATPNPAQDILAARRKRMSMPLRGTASLHSVDSCSPVSARMSLTTNNKSKQTLDSIISNRALLQSTKRPSGLASVTGTAPTPPASPKAQAPSFFRRRSLQVHSSKSAPISQPIVVPPQNNTSTPPASPRKSRPQSLYRHITDPTPTKKSAPLVPTLPLPAFSHPSSRSWHMKTESSPAVSSSSHKPPVSSHLTRSPLTATFPQRPLSLIQEPQVPALDFESYRSNFSNQQKDDEEESPTDSPTDSLDHLYMAPSWMAPLINISGTPPQPISSNTKPSTKPIPKPITITPSTTDNGPPILSPKPITPIPTHIITHKALTLSEVSDLEKPFYIRKRRSSSTLDAVSPKSPTFGTISIVNPPSPTNGNESDSSGVFFPVHPAFAPLGREKSHASMRVEERRRGGGEEKWGNTITISAQDKSGKLKKDKKEKRGSIFGSIKRSFFGRS